MRIRVVQKKENFISVQTDAVTRAAHIYRGQAAIVQLTIVELIAGA